MYKRSVFCSKKYFQLGRKAWRNCWNDKINGGFGRLYEPMFLYSYVQWTGIREQKFSLILISGKFNLDPNRVIDILLEVIECQTQNKKFLIQVMREFGVGSNISQFLGFKLQHFKSMINVTRKTPESLLQVTAMLISEGAVICSDMYAQLTPADKEMNESYKKYVINCRQAARKLTAVVLSETVAEENAKEVQSLQVPPEFGDNQKLGVLQQLVLMGDWEHVNEMLELLPIPCSYVMSFGDIAYNLCQMIHKLIDPLYKRLDLVSSTSLRLR